MLINMLWDDRTLTVTPTPPVIEEEFYIREKSLQPNPERPWERDLVFTKVPLFNTLSKNPKVIQTYQGLLDFAVLKAVAAGHEPTIHDVRNPFPDPALHLMTGFRFSQKALLSQFLHMKRSGMLSAPTRYGKTTLMINVLRAFPNLCTVVTAPGKDLFEQLYEAICQHIQGREIRLLGGRSRHKHPSEDITVCSMDSLHKCDFGRTELVLIDEPHAVVTDSRLVNIDKFAKARRFGFTATPEGRFDGRDKITKGVIGPVLVERTYLEAVAEGAICPLVILMLRVNIPKGTVTGTRDVAYNKLLFQSETMGALTSRICHEIFPADWQSIIFIKNEKQANLYLEKMNDNATIAMAKTMTDKQRKILLGKMERAEVLRCLATNIYSQGVTFHDVRAIINCEGGGDNTTAIQKPGRLAEIRPNKKAGIIVDFLFDCDEAPTEKALQHLNTKFGNKWTGLIKDSRARRKAYERKGYEIHVAENFQDLQLLFQQHAF